MVLNLHGQMGELELETMIGRMVSARWSKAERGELYTIPPAGYDLDLRATRRGGFAGVSGRF